MPSRAAHYGNPGGRGRRPGTRTAQYLMAKWRLPTLVAEVANEEEATLFTEMLRRPGVWTRRQQKMEFSPRAFTAEWNSHVLMALAAAPAQSMPPFFLKTERMVAKFYRRLSRCLAVAYATDDVVQEMRAIQRAHNKDDAEITRATPPQPPPGGLPPNACRSEHIGEAILNFATELVTPHVEPPDEKPPQPRLANVCSLCEAPNKYLPPHNGHRRDGFCPVKQMHAMSRRVRIGMACPICVSGRVVALAGPGLAKAACYACNIVWGQRQRRSGNCNTGRSNHGHSPNGGTGGNGGDRGDGDGGGGQGDNKGSGTDGGTGDGSIPVVARVPRAAVPPARVEAPASAAARGGKGSGAGAGGSGGRSTGKGSAGSGTSQTSATGKCPTYEWQSSSADASLPWGLQVDIPMDGSGIKRFRIPETWQIRIARKSNWCWQSDVVGQPIELSRHQCVGDICRKLVTYYFHGDPQTEICLSLDGQRLVDPSSTVEEAALFEELNGLGPTQRRCKLMFHVSSLLSPPGSHSIILQPLTAAEESEVNDALAPGLATEVLSEVGNVPVTRYDMSTLLSPEWLNDEV